MSQSGSKTICVVDDDLAILEVVELVLQDEGYQVVVNSGQEVEKMVNQHQPDLVLLDVWMQGLDGRDISRHIKQNLQPGQRLPIVLMSAHSDAINSVNQARADGFLSKPFGMDELIQTVEDYIT